MRKKMFVIGIGGLTGSKLCLEAKNDYDIFGSYNLRDPEFSFVKSFKINVSDVEKIEDILTKIKPEIIVNTSGINNVDYCEKHPDEAKKINVIVVKDLCRIAKKLNSKFIHLSSDSVFDGSKKQPYSEEDNPNPINYYGKTKLESEKIVLENSKNVVVRASVLYGYLSKNLAKLESSSKKPINFGQWLVNKLLAKEKVRIIVDENSSPIIADDFARSILHIIKKDGKGIYHSAPKESISRYDFSVKIAKALNLTDGLIEPITNKELGRNVETGFNKCLESQKLSKELNYRFLTLDESLKILKTQFDNEN